MYFNKRYFLIMELSHHAYKIMEFVHSKMNSYCQCICIIKDEYICKYEYIYCQCGTKCWRENSLELMKWKLQCWFIRFAIEVQNSNQIHIWIQQGWGDIWQVPVSYVNIFDPQKKVRRYLTPKKQGWGDIWRVPGRRWESSSFVSFLGCSGATSGQSERLYFLKYLKYKVRIF